MASGTNNYNKLNAEEKAAVDWHVELDLRRQQLSGKKYQQNTIEKYRADARENIASSSEIVANLLQQFRDLQNKVIKEEAVAQEPRVEQAPDFSRLIPNISPETLQGLSKLIEELNRDKAREEVAEILSREDGTVAKASNGNRYARLGGLEIEEKRDEGNIFSKNTILIHKGDKFFSANDTGFITAPQGSGYDCNLALAVRTVVADILKNEKVDPQHIESLENVVFNFLKPQGVECGPRTEI